MTALDTNGAGDTFATAYMLALASGSANPGDDAAQAAACTVTKSQVCTPVYSLCKLLVLHDSSKLTVIIMPHPYHSNNTMGWQAEHMYNMRGDMNPPAGIFSLLSSINCTTFTIPFRILMV